jgi:transcriptional regulator with XRE-family HTH domain
MPRNRDDSLVQAVGKRLKSSRILSGRTQESLAFAVGMAPNTIARLESGDLVPTLPTLSKIAGVLGIRLVDLVDVDVPPPTTLHPQEDEEVLRELAQIPENQKALARRLILSLITELVKK